MSIIILYWCLFLNNAFRLDLWDRSCSILDVLNNEEIKMAINTKEFKEKHGYTWSEGQRRLRKAKENARMNGWSMLKYLREEKGIYNLDDLMEALGEDVQ